MNKNLQLPLYQDFVSPENCQHLVDQGLDIKTVYLWKIRANECWLYTHAFDQDELYKQAIANEEHVHPLDKTLPAFQEGDMEKLLPDYWLMRNDGVYTISCDKIFELPEATADRKPDAFARMVLNAFRKKILSLNKAISLITQ